MILQTIHSSANTLPPSPSLPLLYTRERQLILPFTTNLFQKHTGPLVSSPNTNEHHYKSRGCLLYGGKYAATNQTVNIYGRHSSNHD